MSSSTRVVTQSQSQPVMIRLEEDDDEIKIVRENVLSLASGKQTNAVSVVLGKQMN